MTSLCTSWYQSQSSTAWSFATSINFASNLHQFCINFAPSINFASTMHQFCNKHRPRSETNLANLFLAQHTNTYLMSHSHISHFALTRISCRTHTFLMSHSHVSHFALTRISFRTHAYLMSHSRVSHVALTRISFRTHTYSPPNLLMHPAKRAVTLPYNVLTL